MHGKPLCHVYGFTQPACTPFLVFISSLSKESMVYIYYNNTPIYKISLKKEKYTSM
ncbi:hypothetical protein AB205_0220920 [Aquarana catesbeiana]|uniref:Uncharacterized protein n=1 Tax=Aquarana catesbeiana TaxID=8400 RepID=A0A2G9SKY5_AQUCT|nr:hypothetical protein AB205_0220920 [Aquarana catesbeiana]